MRKLPRRGTAMALGIVGVALLAGCKPDIPLIPFIKSDRVPYGTMAEVTITPPDHSPQAVPVRPHTAP